MIRFDPIGWFERIIPSEWMHRIIRLSAFVIILYFLIIRIGQYHNYFFKPLWLVETLLFTVLVIAFIVRSNPVDRSQGIREIIIPLIGSFLPFCLLKTHPSTLIAGDAGLLTAVFLWMTLATSLTTWGMWTLRHSFSITVEARGLVTRGPYRWVRHPVYLGEILAATSVVVWRWSWINLAILLLFVIIQLLRSRLEESKLEKVFPVYRDILSKSRWFWKI